MEEKILGKISYINNNNEYANVIVQNEKANALVETNVNINKPLYFSDNEGTGLFIDLKEYVDNKIFDYLKDKEFAKLKEQNKQLLNCLDDISEVINNMSPAMNDIEELLSEASSSLKTTIIGSKKERVLPNFTEVASFMATILQLIQSVKGLSKN